jgi:hypothetical protein
MMDGVNDDPVAVLQRWEDAVSVVKGLRGGRMPIRHRRVLWGLAASVTVLSGCSAHAGTSDTAPQTPPPSSAASEMTTTAAIAPAPATQAPRIEKWIDLAVGDCLAKLPPVDQSEVTVTVVDCATPHAAEMYLREPIKVNAAIADVADRQCAVGLSQYTGQPSNGSNYAVTYLIDSNQDRTSNNPYPSAVICLLQAKDGAPLSRSARQ